MLMWPLSLRLHLLALYSITKHFLIIKSNLLKDVINGIFLHFEYCLYVRGNYENQFQNFNWKGESEESERP